MNKRKMTTLATAGLAGLAVPIALGGTAVGQQQTVTTCPAGVTAPSPYCTVTTVTSPPAGTTTGTTTTTNPPVTQTAPSQSPGPGPGGPKLKTNLTVKRKPARDRKSPFRYTISGSVNGGPKTTSCAGKLSITVKRGKRSVQTRKVNVAKNCKFSVKLRYTAKKLKVRKGKLSITVAYQGNDRLRASKHSTSLRFG